MVCSVGNGRMAVMARILAAGSVSNNVPEETDQQKLAAQWMYRELREADEANLLNAEDMHVFGLEPMTDSLHLVCCIDCKKPVKASQYKLHTELCKSLKSVGEIAMRDGGGIRNRKPPKKERKKSLMANTNQVTTIVEQERLESLNVNNVTKLEARFGKQPVMSSSPYSHTTGKSLRMNVASEITDPSLYGIPPPTKRPKPLSNRLPSLGDDPDKPSGLTKFTSCRVKDFQLQSACSTGTKIPIANAVISKRDGHNNDFGLVNTDYPVPLATKIYYPQRRTNRLRSAVAHMYHASLNEEIPCDMSPDVPHRTNQLTASTQMGQHVDEITDYEGDHSAFTPGQISEAEGCLQDTSMSTQFPVSNLLVPQTPPIGLLGSKYLSSPYSLGGNSGQSIGTLQQKNGSVHAL